MHVHSAQPTGPAQYLIPLAIFAVVFALRARRMSRERPLRLEQLWIVPALYFAVCIASFAAKPPTALGWAAVAAGVCIGAAIGWWRGKTTRIAIDPATHRLNQRASPAGILILLGLILAKMLLQTEGRAAHLDALGNGLLGVGLGTFTAMRVEMFLRGRHLLASARLV